MKKRSILYVAILAAVFFGVGLFKPARVEAITSTVITNQAPLPGSSDITDSSGDVVASNKRPWFAVGVGQYRGEHSYAKIYVPMGYSAAVTVENGRGKCNNVNSTASASDNSLDVGFPDVEYYLAALDSVEDYAYDVGSHQLSRPGGSNTCGPLSFSIQSNEGLPSDIHPGMRVFYLEASIFDAPGDNEKNFRVTVSTTSGPKKVYAGISRAVKNYPVAQRGFGIYQRDAPRLGGPMWDFGVQVAPRCNDNLSKSWTIFDADYDVYTPQRLASVIQKLTGGTPSIIASYSGPQLGGQGETNSFTFSVELGFRYAHRFTGVNYRNTLQIQLPYDQYDAQASETNSCYDATCTVTAQGQTMQNRVIGGEEPGKQISVTYTFINTGRVTWKTTDDPRTQSRRYLNGVGSNPVIIPRDIPPPPSSNNSFTITRNETVPAGGSDFIQYTMWRSSIGAFGKKCSLTLSPNNIPPGGGPSLSVSCSQTIISIPKASILATWRPPVGVHTDPPPFPVITRVPAEITINEEGTSNSYTYRVPNGVDTYGGDGYYSVDTFRLSGNMWPHKSYTFQLSIKGTDAQFSSTYDNNGAWTNDYSTHAIPSSERVSNCLTADCGSASSPDAEPGQIKQINAGINFRNTTGVDYDPVKPPNGYYIRIDTDSGIANAPGEAAINVPAGNAQGVASFDARIDYEGNYSYVLMFQGTQLDLPGLDQPCSGHVRPDTRPYLQVWGGDINTGGGFAQASGGKYGCQNNYPAYVSPRSNNLPNPGSANDYGGIKTFYNWSTNKGSLTDFGALSVGIIASDGNKVGFAANPTFANTGVRGLLSSLPSSYCIKNYFETSQSDPAPGLPDFSSSANGQYLVNTDIKNLADGGVVIPAGKKITLFVEGDVTITGNIKYGDWDIADPESAPSFTLVVKGDINIDKDVTRIDGRYIAQPPKPAVAEGGEFNTCADNSDNQFCTKQLVVNGAVIARKILPLRSHGTLGPLDGDVNGLCSPYPLNLCPAAEIFNFAPSALLSEPLLAPESPDQEGLRSLPPVF